MKKILISADPYETRVAIVEDNVVVETYLERATRRSLLGNVYLGRVDNVLPGMEAAFIDAGLPKNCFLYVDEIVLPELDDRERRKKKIAKRRRSPGTRRRKRRRRRQRPRQLRKPSRRSRRRRRNPRSRRNSARRRARPHRRHRRRRRRPCRRG